MDLNLHTLSFLSFHWTALSSKVTIKVEEEEIKFLNKLPITFLYMFRLIGSLFPRMPLKGALTCLSRPSASSEGSGIYPSHRLSWTATNMMMSVINIVSLADNILQVISTDQNIEKSNCTWCRGDSPVQSSPLSFITSRGWTWPGPMTSILTSSLTTSRTKYKGSGKVDNLV